MKKFEIGDYVIALTNPRDESCQSRVKGNIYKVLELKYCSKCGIQSIHIGGKTKIVTSNIGNCGICGVEYTQLMSFTRSELFSKVDEDSLQEAVSEEEYELAAIIRDNLKK